MHNEECLIDMIPQRAIETEIESFKEQIGMIF